jgi:probable phosphoglycerate mutase
LTNEGFVPDVVVASTLPRAFQTAETLASGFDAAVERHADLCEFVPGEIDGRPWEEYTDRFDILEEPDRPLSAGGESLNVFRARVRSVLERLAATHDGRTVLAVCHGGVIGTSFGEIFGIAGGERYWVDIDNTSITEWRRTDDRWHLVRFNDVAHLLGSDLLERV